MSKPTAVITENHLYGYGGGAQAVLKFAYALDRLGYDVTVCGKRPIAVQNLQELGRLGIPSRAYYRNCSHGADLLLNIDHGGYEPPLAKLNLCHIFHPYRGNDPREYVPLDNYRFSANSMYTSRAIAQQWNILAPHVYIPISRTFFQARKQPIIMHVSRFSRPNEVADKGHYEMIRAFESMCDVGLEGWTFVIVGSLEDPGFANELRAYAQKYPISFLTNPTDEALTRLYSEAAIYWHATGISMPDVPSAQEHLGLTTIEAMASGTVPVVLGTGGQPEILSGKHCGVMVRDQKDLAQGTLDLIGNLSIWSDLSRHAILEAKPWQDHAAFVERVAAWINDDIIPDLPPAEDLGTEFAPYDVTVVMPVYDGADFTIRAVKSMLATEPTITRLVIMDTGSTDATEERLRPLLRENDRYLRVGYSRNYSSWNMEAKASIDTPLVLAANNDLIFLGPDWLQKMCDVMQDGVGIVGAKLLFPDGTLQHAGANLDWNRPDIGYHRFYQQPDQPAANQYEGVNYVTGALMLCRKELWNWDVLGGGLNYEDADLCLQAKQAGWRVVYQPAARAVHYQGITKALVEGASDNFTDEKSLTQRNAAVFIERWYEKFRAEQPQWRLEREYALG